MKWDLHFSRNHYKHNEQTNQQTRPITIPPIRGNKMTHLYRLLRLLLCKVNC